MGSIPFIHFGPLARAAKGQGARGTIGPRPPLEGGGDYRRNPWPLSTEVVAIP
jgi:hypothetical protein